MRVTVAGAAADRALTARQRAVLEAIVSSAAADGRPPTLRELGRRLGISSTNGVRDHLRALTTKGYIRRNARSARSIQVLRAPEGPPLDIAVASAHHQPGRAAARVAVVPVVGRLAAGQRPPAALAAEQQLAIDGRLVHGDVFALRVQGNSMRGAGILDGDLVFVQPQATVRPQDIVVAVVDDEAMAKRYVPDGDMIRLEPENPGDETVIVHRDDDRVAILGRVSAVLRTI